MAVFLIPTFVLLVLGVLIALKNKRYEKLVSQLFGIVSFTTLLILSGMRGLNVGVDTEMFVRVFRNTPNGLADLDKYADRFEYGYRLFQCTIAEFTSDPHALLFLGALVTLILMYVVFYKESRLPWFSILMFMTLMFYYNSMNMMRQYIAIALTCTAIYCLTQDKKVAFVCFTIIAGLFHTSAYIVLILLPLSYIKINTKKRYIYIVVSAVIALGIGSLLPLLIRMMPNYQGYLTSDRYFLQNQLGTILKVLVYLLFFILVDYSYRKSSDGSKAEQVEYWASLLGLVITLAAINGSILTRMGTYFSIMFCISVPNSLVKIPNKTNKTFLAIFVMGGCLMYNLVILIFRPYWSGVLPYTFWQ